MRGNPSTALQHQRGRSLWRLNLGMGMFWVALLGAMYVGIDHSFEKGLQRTQAEYSQNPDGSIQVINRGFNAKLGEWKISHGKAKPTIAPDIAALKVSFFGPFYGGYNVVALDDNYQWAMVIGSKLDYFWILSRQPSLPPGIEEQLMQQAQRLGVDTQKILWVHQDGVNPTGNYK